MVFCVWIPWSKHLKHVARKAKNTRLAARVTLFSSLGTSRVFGSEYPNTENRYVFLYYFFAPDVHYVLRAY